MSKYATQKDLEKTMEQQTKTILEAMNFKFESMQSGIDIRFEEAKEERMGLRKSVSRIENILDSVLGRLTNLEGEFSIIRAEGTEVKKVIKNKLGVEISLLGK
jgi:predicted  nucleic acid-binding Zn-ribbon protein